MSFLKDFPVHPLNFFFASSLSSISFFFFFFLAELMKTVPGCRDFYGFLNYRAKRYKQHPIRPPIQFVLHWRTSFRRTIESLFFGGVQAILQQLNGKKYRSTTPVRCKNCTLAQNDLQRVLQACNLKNAPWCTIPRSALYCTGVYVTESDCSAIIIIGLTPGKQAISLDCVFQCTVPYKAFHLMYYA